jgi:D-alanyl-D-alanine carboxypeptidase
MAEAEIEGDPSKSVSQGKTVRVSTLVERSPRPPARPVPADPAKAAAAEVAVAALQDTIDQVVAQATAPAEPPPFQVVTEPPAAIDAALAEVAPETPADPAAADPAPAALAAADVPALRPMPRPAPAAAPAPPADIPFQVVAADPGAQPADPVETTAETPFEVVTADPPPAPVQAGMGLPVTLSARPAPRPAPDGAPPVIEFAAAAPAPAEPLRVRPRPKPAEPEVVTRISTSGGRHWGVTLGQFNSRGAAERALMRTALSESVTLGDGLRKIVQRNGAFEANMMGLTQEQADLACRRLQARAATCFTIGP